MTISHKASSAFFLVAFWFVACSPPQANTATSTLARNDAGQPDTVKQTNVQAQASAPKATPTPELSVAFGNGLRIVPETVKFENQKRRYKVDLVYPRIDGSRRPQILSLNRRIKNLAAEQYRWLLNSNEPHTHSLYQYPDVSNWVNLTYEVPLATDELLSIYLNCYTYGVGAAHSVQQSFTINYDMKSGRLLKLTDIFDRRKEYLRFLSQRCADELAKRHGDVALFKEALAPRAKNFQSWNITEEGITINFDACTVLACSPGQQGVTIPFREMKGILKPVSPVASFAK